MYILRPDYGDMDIVSLGSSLKTIIKKLKAHWQDELEHPEDYGKKHIDGVKSILSKNYSTIKELAEDYNKLGEDYLFEESK